MLAKVVVQAETSVVCLLLSPFVLTTDLLLLLWGEVVLNVEGLADLLGRLALDHVGNGFTADVKKSLDVEEIGSLSHGFPSASGSQ